MLFEPGGGGRWSVFERSGIRFAWRKRVKSRSWSRSRFCGTGERL